MSNPSNYIKLIECPRDAMQGWMNFIPTEKKIAYINSLLKVGFDTIDFGSFVSPKAIPQMADTAEVLNNLDLKSTRSKLLAIIANKRGAEEAVKHEAISYLGYPFSISETFQYKNTNASIGESFSQVGEIQNLCVRQNKKLVIYISMGFGNPYGDLYNEQIVYEWMERLKQLDIEIFSLADTVGLANAEQVFQITSTIIKSMPDTEIGVHLHSTAENWKEKVDAALEAGCRRFDGAIKGIGGCPMAGNTLVGNMNTELMISYFAEKAMLINIDKNWLNKSSAMASEIFI